MLHLAFERALYIGKATKNNLHHRVWDHVKAPERLVDKNGWMTFPNTTFASSARPELVEDIRKGHGRLHIFTVSDLDTVSVLETYLQVMFIKINGHFPPFNKQIG